MSQSSLRNRSHSPAARTATPAIERLESRQLFNAALPTATDLGTLYEVQRADSVSSTDTLNVNLSDAVGGAGLTSASRPGPTNYNQALMDAARRLVGSAVSNSGFQKAVQR